MDATEEDQDVYLQRASSDLLADLEKSLSPFLWKTSAKSIPRIRRKVRVRETERQVALLEPFQELPQLLDPHLGRLLPTLTDALLEYLRSAPATATTKPTSLLIPLSEAICKLLYTFCKIRGEKIVVRFFSAETRHLELLLSAVETADAVSSDDDGAAQGWSWEERYIILLWLSHLLLVPFDLATISSAATIKIPEIAGLIWPANLPGVTLRVIPLAMKYLGSAGKERDAAKVLLVRISMRKDMQELGLLDALVRWALSSLQSPTVANSTYHYIGVLSYLAGVLVSSSSTSDMDPYLSQIFAAVQDSDENAVAAFKTIHSSALARKTVIKVMRTIAVLELRGSAKSSAHGSSTTEIVETTIGYMLEALADNDTPVRLAASKALSVITQKLAPLMAAQVVEAVIDSLSHNVLWETKDMGQKQIKVRDLSAVNPLEWHGLILTLSQLLYRRSPPPDTLSGILHLLLIGLSFERRSTSGSSIGTNVRDAACFGIWALARRYTTVELQAIDRSSLIIAKHHDETSSIVQILATELVVAACLDSAGNIRRGSSAALQELIGRHPDKVENGIAVVQTVDYHRVALRSKAMKSVGPDAASLSKYNEDALIDALFGWRGIGDGDAVSRRSAAICLGTMASLHFHEGSVQCLLQCVTLMSRIEQQLKTLKLREVDQRHGLLLSLAAILRSIYTCFSKEQSAVRSLEFEHAITESQRITVDVLTDASLSNYRRPELIAEGVSALIAAFCPLMKIRVTTDEKFGVAPPIMDELLDTYLARSEDNVISASMEAVLAYIPVIDQARQRTCISNWIAKVSSNGKSKNLSIGHMTALGTVFQLVSAECKTIICETMISRWRAAMNVETRIIILSAVCEGTMLTTHGSEFVHLIVAGLEDYTVDARGDVGSQVRIKALQATAACLGIAYTSKNFQTSALDAPSIWLLYGHIVRLAAEKLDKVRTEAQTALIRIIAGTQEAQRFGSLLTSSSEYFAALLDLQTHEKLASVFDQDHLPTESAEFFEYLLSGYVTSADAGSESLIRSSRSALIEFCTQSEDSCHVVYEALVQVMKKNLENDRVLISAMEVLSFLFSMQILPTSSIKFRSLFITTQRAHYKSGNVRKLETAVKLYGALLNIFQAQGDEKNVKEVLKKLVGMLLHPFPAVRGAVVDVLWMEKGLGKGMDWTKGRKEWAEYKGLKAILGVE